MGDMRTVVLAMTALSLVFAADSAYGQDRRDALGSYERQALDRALTTRALEIDPAPAGKTLRIIHVVNQDVFTEGEGLLTWLNALHRTTREDVIEREVLLRPGQTWDDAVIEDSMRRLRDPRFTNVVVMMPVKAPEPDRVDLLVVTRDIWSLRLNSDYEIQNGELINFLLAPAESNFLGLRKQLAFVFELDQGAYSLGPYYVDTNIAGTHVRLDARSSTVFSRGSSDLEGTRNNVVMTYPLWSLRRRWGASIIFTHIDDIERDYLGIDLRPRDLESTPDVQEAVPYIYDRRNTRLDVNATRSLGGSIKHNLSFGYELFINRPTVHGDGPTAEQCADTPLAECVELFRQEVLPRSERSSSLYTQYSMFTPDFRTYRNIDTYDLPEERQLGPDLRLGVAMARRFYGSEQDFLRLSSQLGWTVPIWPSGFASATVLAASRLQGGELIDNELRAQVAAISPTLLDFVRVTGFAQVATFLDDSENRYFTLGGDNGLRGYTIGAFAGERLVRGHLEVRSRPGHAWFTRFGVLGFWDLGHAADRFSNLRIHHDVGIGFRAVLPQLQTAVFRLDWAVPLTGDTAGLPGRFILGFEQVFNVLGTSPVLDGAQE
jgi:hypothetical protein